jgi:hypothetical protein
MLVGSRRSLARDITRVGPVPALPSFLPGKRPGSHDHGVRGAAQSGPESGILMGAAVMARRLFRCAWIVCAVLIAARPGPDMQATGLGRQSAGVAETPIPSLEARKTIDQYYSVRLQPFLRSSARAEEKAAAGAAPAEEQK